MTAELAASRYAILEDNGLISADPPRPNHIRYIVNVFLICSRKTRTNIKHPLEGFHPLLSQSISARTRGAEYHGVGYSSPFNIVAVARWFQEVSGTTKPWESTGDRQVIPRVEYLERPGHMGEAAREISSLLCHLITMIVHAIVMAQHRFHRSMFGHAHAV